MNSTDDKINFTAARILAIGKDAPEKLFSGDPEIMKAEFYALSRIWHPDRNPDRQATAVFQRITELCRAGKELLKNGEWRGAGVLELKLPGSGAGKDLVRRLEYLRKARFELGEMYLGKREIAFAVERQYADLFENARRQISKFRFADDSMRRTVERVLPGMPEYFADGKNLIMVLPKPSDMVLLEDLLEHLGGAIDARHAGWIGNRLHNLACYFSFVGIVHQDISPRTVFVSPKSHDAMLLGGWWYARFKGEKIKALPARSINCAPPDVLRRREADPRLDLELIRRTERELLGAKTDAKLAADENIPTAMARWLNGATSGCAVTDYELWQNVLEMDFGAPRFLRLEVRPEEIYGV